MNPSQVLKNVFGYDSFRPLQQQIISNVLNKKDSLVVMPTGGGKSICYQVPALLFEGLTVVISPLISLMKDQVEQLRQLGVKTALLNSSLSPEDYKQNFKDVENNSAKLLYLAPESLVKNDITNLLSNVKVDCLTVDEAHCISEWGHDFRKDYRLLGNFRKKFPEAVCLALTATATPKVQDDIITNLKMKNAEKFIASFNRKNLFLQVIPKRNAYKQTLDFLNEHKDQSGIIYCFSRKQVDNLAEDLSLEGFSVKPYHAGLSDKERNINQDLFIKDEVQIIVATIAFGMGINKSNVRFILHHDLPKNIESYYQEIGRSGRDGVKADCLLLYSYSDISKINYFIDQKEDETERLSAKIHLDAMVKFAESELCRRKTLITYFGESYEEENCGMCDNCLKDIKELTDITIPAQKFLSAVKRTGEIFGVNYIIDVLLGSDDQRIINNGHHNLSVYGIGKEYGKKQWQTLAHQFIKKELLERNIEFGSLKLSDKAANVLFNNEKVYGIIKEPVPVSANLKEEQAYDKNLFELLRKKRKELADEYNVPPYVIFSDKTLIEMCITYPVTESSLLEISGIGIRKLENYGGIFLSIIKSYCQRKNINPAHHKNQRRERRIKPDKPKHVLIGESFNDGSSIKELAEEYQIKEQTVISNLSKFVNEGNKIRREGLVEKLSVDNLTKEKVFEEFDNEGTVTLKNIFDKFDQKVSYEDLHLLRILYRLEKLNHLQK